MLGPAPEHDTTTIAAGVKSGIDWPTPAATEPPQPALLQFPDSTLEALGDKQAEQEEGEKGDLAKQDILSGDIDTGHLSEGGEGGVAGGVMATTSSLSRAHIPAGTQDQSYDYRYEFSETRKVLEEFFKAENEFPASSSPPLGLSNPPMGLQTSPTAPPHTQQSIHTAYRSSQGGADLDYSLKRHAGNSYVGQRLADADDDIVAAVISKQSEQQQGGVQVKQQISEQQQPRKQHNEQQQQQHDGPQATAGGSSQADHQQPTSSKASSGSNGEVRVLEGYKDNITTMGGYGVNKDGSTYSKDLLDLCTSVTPPPPASQPQSTTAANTMAQVSSHSRRPKGDRDSQTFPEFDPTRELPPPPPAYDSRNFTLSPETTDCDSADLESELRCPQ